jgi:hypothetical protein
MSNHAMWRACEPLHPGTLAEGIKEEDEEGVDEDEEEAE